MKRKQLDWMASVKIGDVLENSKGTQRIVRYVSRYADGDLRSIAFVINRCSWTHRPYTIVSYSYLRHHGYFPVGVNIKLNTELSIEIQKNIENSNYRTVTCCQVKGLA